MIIVVMIDLTQGRSRRCKDSIGGFKQFWITPFIDYHRSEIIVDGVNLIRHPSAFVYKFDVSSGDFTQTQTQEDGGKMWEQKLSVT